MTGYRGRAGLFELLTVSDAARSFIQPTCDEAQAARRRRCRTACGRCAWPAR